MDWSGAVERNREALKRLLSSLVAMASIALPHPEVRAGGEPRNTLPRHLHRAILRLLRPAEAAARRLIVVVACGLVPPPLRRATRYTPTPDPSPQGGGGQARRSFFVPREARGSLTSPLRGGRDAAGGAGGGTPAARTLALPLTDRLYPPRLRRPAPSGIPRISLPGFGAPYPVPLRQPLSPDDPISAAPLGLRLNALASALDDMPRHAMRFARWKSRRDRRLVRRTRPLKPSRPPGGRLARYDPAIPRGARIREVDEILAHAHALAFHALESPDTS